MLQVEAMQRKMLVQQNDALNCSVMSSWHFSQPAAKQNPCYVHFSYFWLHYTASRSTTCASASTGILVSILSFYLEPCRERSWYKERMHSIGSLIFCWNISLNHRDTSHKTEFLLCAFLLLLATLHWKQMHYLCFSLNWDSLERLSAAYSTTYWEHLCFRIIHCTVVAWTISRRFL